MYAMLPLFLLMTWKVNVWKLYMLQEVLLSVACVCGWVDRRCQTSSIRKSDRNWKYQQKWSHVYFRVVLERFTDHCYTQWKTNHNSKVVEGYFLTNNCIVSTFLYQCDKNNVIRCILGNHTVTSCSDWQPSQTKHSCRLSYLLSVSRQLDAV